MMASRRLHLAAESSGAIGIAVRRWRRQTEAASPRPPAAHRQLLRAPRDVAEELARQFRCHGRVRRRLRAQLRRATRDFDRMRDLDLAIAGKDALDLIQSPGDQHDRVARGIDFEGHSDRRLAGRQFHLG